MNTIKKWTRKLIALALAIISTVTLVIPMRAQAAEYINYYGGCEIARENLNVYSTSDCTYKIGTIYKYEGYTVLLKNSPEDYMWVEYSTPSGTKRGYVSVPRDEGEIRKDGLAKVNATSTVYYGRTDTTGKYGSYQSTGTVYAGELVAIIAKNDNWAYIEYNTTAGRKRGYMLYSNLEVYNRPEIFPDFYNYNKTGTSMYVSGRTYVYSGPTSLFAQVGWVENEYVTKFSNVAVVYDENGNWMWSQYIEYQSGGQTKSGFIVFGP
mgnify:CR=1 FL=1